MIIGERLRAWREYKALSLADMEKRTGFYRYHISRLENGHAIPTLETLTRFARAFEIPLFHLVYEEDGPYRAPTLPQSSGSAENSGELSRSELRLLEQFNPLITQLPERDRRLLLALARRMFNRLTQRTLARRRSKRGRNGRRFRPSASIRTGKHRLRPNKRRTPK